MKPPSILIQHVSQGPYISIARFSGGVRINGYVYRYFDGADELVRDDWMKAYRTLPRQQFLEAAATGIMPELPNRQPKVKPDKEAESDLFDQ